MVIGISGKSGSGKSTVCEYLKNAGFFVVDCDKIGHDILKSKKEGYNKVIAEFPFAKDEKTGEIDRKKLGKAVFSDKDKLKRLNEITLPLIEKKVFHLLEKQKEKNAVIDGAHLYSSEKIMSKCNFFIEVTSDKCAERIMKRDNLSENEAKNRLSSQKSLNFECCTLENNGTLEELYEKIDKIINRMN